MVVSDNAVLLKRHLRQRLRGARCVHREASRCNHAQTR